MKIFATREYRLSQLPFGARLFYSLFLGMVFLGLLTCLGFAFGKSGISSDALAEYYRPDGGGYGGKSFLELLETAHFHLFSMPIFFLVIDDICSQLSRSAALAYLSSSSRRWRRSTVSSWLRSTSGSAVS